MKNLFIIVTLVFNSFVYSQTKPTTHQNTEKKSAVVASFGKHKGNSEITREELKSLLDLSLISQSTSKGFIIVSYEVNIKAGGTLKSFIIHGPTLSTEAKEYLISCSTGTRVFIEEITIKDENGKLSKASGITLTIK